MMNTFAKSLLGVGMICLMMCVCTEAKATDQLKPKVKDTTQTPAKPDTVMTLSGLQYVITKPGTGAVAEPGKTVTVHYTGWLMNGTKFDSSVDRGTPFSFALGQHRVIKGWEEGVAGIKEGETRILIVPPDLAYGSRGAGSVIPPNATLKFEVQLLHVQ
jgi:FKBP-type peptidyl-prolyl cis-trans isomerase